MKLSELFPATLKEDAALDLEMGRFTSKAAHTALRRVYEGETGQIWNFGDYGKVLVFLPTTLGISKVFPTTLIGFAKRGSQSVCIDYDRPFYMDFDRLIILSCLDGFAHDEVRKAAGSLAVHRTLKHELTHVMDSVRLGKKAIKSSDGLDDTAYFNSPTEFNAYYHDVADGLTSLGDELDACEGYHDAMELLGLFGFTGDFKHDVTVLLDRRGDRPRERFLKWISADNSKKLLRRLYLLHTEVMRRIEALKKKAA